MFPDGHLWRKAEAAFASAMSATAPTLRLLAGRDDLIVADVRLAGSDLGNEQLAHAGGLCRFLACLRGGSVQCPGALNSVTMQASRRCDAAFDFSQCHRWGLLETL